MYKQQSKSSFFHPERLQQAANARIYRKTQAWLIISCQFVSCPRGLALVWQHCTFVKYFWCQIFISATFQYSGVTFPPLGADPLAPGEELWKPIATSKDNKGQLLIFWTSSEAEKHRMIDYIIFQEEEGCPIVRLHEGLFLNQSVGTVHCCESDQVKLSGKKLLGIYAK